MQKELVKVSRATVDFYKYEKDGLVFYEYDATQLRAPEPMVNTMAGFSLLKDKNIRLVGLFFQEPFPLYSRIPLSIEYETIELDSGDFQITFKLAE